MDAKEREVYGKVMRYLNKEQNNTRSISLLVEFDRTDFDYVPLLVAPIGGVELLRIHLCPVHTITANPSAYWTFALEVYKITGEEVRHVKNFGISTATLPFTIKKTITLPIMGRFGETLESGEVLHLKGTATGTAGNIHMGIQLDYLLGA